MPDNGDEVEDITWFTNTSTRSARSFGFVSSSIGTGQPINHKISSSHLYHKTQLFVTNLTVQKQKSSYLSNCEKAVVSFVEKREIIGNKVLLIEYKVILNETM